MEVCQRHPGLLGSQPSEARCSAQPSPHLLFLIRDNFTIRLFQRYGFALGWPNSFFNTLIHSSQVSIVRSRLDVFTAPLPVFIGVPSRQLLYFLSERLSFGSESLVPLRLCSARSRRFSSNEGSSVSKLSGNQSAFFCFYPKCQEFRFVDRLTKLVQMLLC